MSYQPVFALFWEKVKESIENGTYAKLTLAKTIGDDKALMVYIHLLNKTAEVAALANAHKAVFYSEYIEEADEFIKEDLELLQLFY